MVLLRMFVGAKFGNKNLIMKWYKPAASARLSAAADTASTSSASLISQPAAALPETLTVTINTAASKSAAAPVAPEVRGSVSEVSLSRVDSVLDEQDDLLAGEANEEVSVRNVKVRVKICKLVIKYS